MGCAHQRTIYIDGSTVSRRLDARLCSVVTSCHRLPSFSKCETHRRGPRHWVRRSSGACWILDSGLASDSSHSAHGELRVHRAEYNLSLPFSRMSISIVLLASVLKPAPALVSRNDLFAEFQMAFSDVAMRIIACTLRSTSSSVVAHEETEIRIAVWPCHSVPPHQQAPSS
jgi:hypothetical protein